MKTDKANSSDKANSADESIPLNESHSNVGILKDPEEEFSLPPRNPPSKEVKFQDDETSEDSSSSSSDSSLVNNSLKNKKPEELSLSAQPLSSFLQSPQPQQTFTNDQTFGAPSSSSSFQFPPSSSQPLQQLFTNDQTFGAPSSSSSFQFPPSFSQPPQQLFTNDQIFGVQSLNPPFFPDFSELSRLSTTTTTGSRTVGGQSLKFQFSSSSEESLIDRRVEKKNKKKTRSKRHSSNFFLFSSSSSIMPYTLQDFHESLQAELEENAKETAKQLEQYINNKVGEHNSKMLQCYPLEELLKFYIETRSKSTKEGMKWDLGVITRSRITIDDVEYKAPRGFVDLYKQIIAELPIDIADLSEIQRRGQDSNSIFFGRSDARKQPYLFCGKIMRSYLTFQKELVSVQGMESEEISLEF